EKEDEIVERLGFYDLEDYCEHRLTYEGDKLAGYPLWVQGMEYSGCPICHEPMRQVFQLVSEDNLPYMFGDVGIGHVLQCQTHKEQLAFIWACS
ncbi:MAG TPA: molybdate metabolism regulator, partial [Cyanobacteria bacterium UBA11162]|nr:molybdate metabolism regulator [Cyanobacteria bacterium UBA11162]